ncbi:MAG: protein TolQ [Cocleimonas sp.]|nr:protein TolQ [Cocleimonas sp.]
MSFDQTILQLILDASLIVKVVMAILVLASIASWFLIFMKSGQINKAYRRLDIFEDRFWSGISLNKLYNDLSQRTDREGMAAIFFGGYHEYARLNKGETPRTLPIVDTAARAMRVAETRELDKLEQNLTFLATVGSTSPYIGLFGTVWGIMNSFLSLSAMKQATLAVVAPGIAEALIATAIGLFAAIPAVIAYNRFSDRVDRISVRYENFREEFTTLLERQVILKNGDS